MTIFTTLYQILGITEKEKDLMFKSGATVKTIFIIAKTVSIRGTKKNYSRGLSEHAHPNQRVLFLDPCRPLYVSTALVVKNQENIPSFQSTHL